MGERISAGTTIGISASAPGTFNAAGYEAVVFTTIGTVENIDGDLGAVSQLVTFTPLADGIDRKHKGGANMGSVTVQLGLDEDDTGQQLAITAGAPSNKATYYFELTFPNGDKRWFPALVMGFRERVGGANDVTRAMMPLELTASAGGVGIVRYNAA